MEVNPRGGGETNISKIQEVILGKAMEVPHDIKRKNKNKMSKEEEKKADPIASSKKKFQSLPRGEEKKKAWKVWWQLSAKERKQRLKEKMLQERLKGGVRSFSEEVFGGPNPMERRMEGKKNGRRE